MKSIVLTATSTFVMTIGAVAVIAYFFLNTILAAFGMVATSISALQKLQASQQVVEKMRKKHADRKRTATKRLVTRSTKRVGSVALAAATVGTVAVAVTMTSFEIADYCDEKRWLHEDANILEGTESPFNLSQCFKDGKKEAKDILNELKKSSDKAITGALARAARYSKEKWDAVRAASVQALQSLGEGAGGLWDAAKSWVVR